MKPTENDITLVERYFDAELTGDETIQFNNRVAQDEAFKALVQREKIIIGAIRNQGLLDNLQYLKSIEEKIQGEQSQPPASKIKSWYYYAAAAIITIVLAVRILLPTQPSTDELFASYFTPYQNIFEPTTRGEQLESKRVLAFQAYDQQNYEMAATLFSDVFQKEPASEILFLLGNSNLMLGKTQEAQENFVTLIKNFDDLDLQAKWYLSLCYIKNGEQENARKILSELGNTKSSYASKATELIKKLD